MRRLVGAVAMLGVLALTGCGGGEPLPTLPPTPSATPVFASEEEALAAAEQAYAAYQAAVDFALRTLDDSGLAGVSSGEALANALESVSSLKEKGSHQVGVTSVAWVGALDLSPLFMSGVTGEPQVYACLDLTDVGIQAADGSIVQSGIPLFPMLVTFDLHEQALLVAREEVWDGDNFCS